MLFEAARSTGLRRLLILTSALVFVDVLLFSALAPLLPTYVDDFGLSKTEAGVLSAAYAAGALVAALPAGFLANRFGPKRIVYAGLAALSFSSLFVGWGHSIVVLDGARFLQGASGSLIWSGALTWLIAKAPPDRKGAFIGTAIGAGVAGALVGPALGALAAALGAGPMFSMTVVVAAILAWAASHIDDAHSLDRQSAHEVSAAVATRSVLNGIAFDAIPALAFGILAVLAPLRMSALGGGAGIIAAAFVGTALLEAILAPVVGRWSDRGGRRAPYIVGLTICGASLAIIAVADTLPVLIAALLVTSIGGGICVTPAFTMLSDAAAEQELSQSFAVALTNTSWSLGQAAGALCGGALASLGGNDVPLVGMVGVLSLTALYARSALPRHPAAVA
jgi:MFS family permease